MDGAGALLLWTLGHVALFSLYFYPSSRFYLAPLALCLVLLATACGVGLSRPGRARWLAAAPPWPAWRCSRRGDSPSSGASRCRISTPSARGARFDRWLEIGDERRADRVMPFDPVHAQALGLLTPEVASQVHAWGELPDTVEVRVRRTASWSSIRRATSRALESPRR